MNKPKMLYGKERDAAIRRVKEELPHLLDAQLREKLCGIHDYLAIHPEISARIMCDAFEVDQGTYRHFIKTGATGDNGRVAHRQILLSKIREIQEATHNASVPETIRQLKALGYKCARPLVTDLMEDAGYVTNPYSLNGIFGFLASQCPNGRMHENG